MFTHAITQALIDGGMANEQRNEVANMAQSSRSEQPPIHDPRISAIIQDLGRVRRRLEEAMPLPPPVPALESVPPPPPYPEHGGVPPMPLLEAIPILDELSDNIRQATARLRERAGDINHNDVVV